MSQEKISLSSLTPDSLNANVGTQRGRGHLETSIRKYGFLEPGVLDKHNHIVGGNKRAEVCAELGMDEAIVIESDGTRPIYIRQTHLDLNTPEGREAAVALNRTAQISIHFDGDVLADLAEMGADFSSFFFDEELAALLKSADMPLEAMPESPDSEDEPAAVPTHTCPKCGHEFVSA